MDKAATLLLYTLQVAVIISCSGAIVKRRKSFGGCKQGNSIGKWYKEKRHTLADGQTSWPLFDHSFGGPD